MYSVTVLAVKDALMLGSALPSHMQLEQVPDLAAACLRALDLTATLRLALVLHADDPVQPSSPQQHQQQQRLLLRASHSGRTCTRSLSMSMKTKQLL